MVSIGSKVPEEVKRDIEIIARSLRMTASDVIRICVTGLTDGHYEIDGEKLMPTDEYIAALSPVNAEEYERLGFSGVLHLMR